MRQTTEQKLDMALDDLVEKRSTSWSDARSRGAPDRLHRLGEASERAFVGRRDAPYDGREGKGKGKRRVPPEDKALLHTRCFFNEDGDFVVRLYETEVVTLRKRPEPIGTDCAACAEGGQASESAGAGGTSATADTANLVDSTSAADEKPVAANNRDVHVDGSDKPSAKSQASTAAPRCGMVAIVSSGNFRTVETRYILNEVLHLLQFRVTEGSDNKWTVVEANGAEMPLPFEDGMQIRVRDAALRVSTVKDYLAVKIGEAKEREAVRASSSSRRASSARFREEDYGPHRSTPAAGLGAHLPAPQYAYSGHQRLPPGWPTYPGVPPSWSPAVYGHHTHAHPVYRSPQVVNLCPVATAQPPPRASVSLSGPLPDSLFQ